MSGKIFWGSTRISRLFKGDQRIKRVYLPDIDKTITLAEKIDYSSPVLYPAPGDEEVYEDNDLFIFFGDKELQFSNLEIIIKKNGETVETISETFTAEDDPSYDIDNEVALNSTYSFLNNSSGEIEQSGRELNVGVQKLKFHKNTSNSSETKFVRIKPATHFDNDVKYTIEVSGITNSNDDDFNTIFGIDEWTFFTRSKKTINDGNIYVSNNLNDYDADFRTIGGAFKYINNNPDRDYVVTVDGTTDEPYYELLYLKNNGKVEVKAKGATFTDKIAIDNSTSFDNSDGGNFTYIDSNINNNLKPVIKFSNCGQLNELMTERGLFEFDGSGTLILNNLRFINTYRRKLYHTGTTYYAGEALGMGGTGNLIARDCEFTSKQDTLMLLNKCWFYNCFITGDVDYIWGYEGLNSALIENSYLRCYLDNDRLSLESKTDTQACIMAPRQSKDLFVGKGIVLLNDYISIDNNTKTYYGRNPWDDDYINNGAVINCKIYSNDTSVSHDGSYTGLNSWFKSALWLSAGNDEGYEQLGFKDYNTTQDDSSGDTETVETTALRRYIKYVYYVQDKNYSYQQINFSIKFNFNQFTFNNSIFTDTSNDGKLGITALALKNVELIENTATIGTKTSFTDAGCDFKFNVAIPFYSINSGTCTYNSNSYSNYKKKYTSYTDYTYYKGYQMTGVSDISYTSSDPETYYNTAVNNEAADNNSNVTYYYPTDAKDLTFGTFNTNPVQNNNIVYGSTTRKDYVKAGEQLTWPSSTSIDIVSANQSGTAIYGYDGRTASWVRTYFIPESTGSYNPRSQFWFYGTITYPTTIGSSFTSIKNFWKRACNNSVVYNFVKTYKTYEGSTTEDDPTDVSSNPYPDYTLYGSTLYNEGKTDTVDGNSYDVYAGSEYLTSTSSQTIDGVSYLREKWIKYDYATDLRCGGTEEISEDYYDEEYSTRDKIMNRVFDLRDTTASVVKDKEIWTEYNDYLVTPADGVTGNSISNISMIEFSKMNSSITYEGNSGTLSPTYVESYTGITYNVDATSGKFYRNKTYGVFNSGTKLTINSANGKTLRMSVYLTNYENISYTDSSGTTVTLSEPSQLITIDSDSFTLSFNDTTNISSIYIY